MVGRVSGTILVRSGGKQVGIVCSCKAVVNTHARASSTPHTCPTAQAAGHQLPWQERADRPYLTLPYRQKKAHLHVVIRPVIQGACGPEGGSPLCWSDGRHDAAHCSCTSTYHCNHSVAAMAAAGHGTVAAIQPGQRVGRSGSLLPCLTARCPPPSLSNSAAVHSMANSDKNAIHVDSFS